MTAPDAPGLRELGIASTDEELVKAAASDTPFEVDGVLARAGLELRRSMPNPDHLVGWLRGRIKE